MDSLDFHQANQGSLLVDWEHGIALNATKENQASSLAEGKFHCFTRVAAVTLGIFSRYGGRPFKTRVFSVTSGLLSSYDGYLMDLIWLGRTIRMLLEVWHETEGHFLVGTVILGFLTIFKKSQASSTFEALNSACLSSC